MASNFSRGISFLSNTGPKIHGLQLLPKKVQKSNISKLLDECIASLQKQKHSEEHTLQKSPRKVVRINPSIQPIEELPSINKPLTHLIVAPNIYAMNQKQDQHLNQSSTVTNNEKKIPAWEEPVLLEFPPPPENKSLKLSRAEKRGIESKTEPVLLEIPEFIPPTKKQMEVQINITNLLEEQSPDVPSSAPPLVFSEPGIYPLLTTSFPKVLFIAMNQETGRIAKKLLSTEDTCKTCVEPADLILYLGNPDIKNWEHKQSILSVVFLVDNEGSDIQSNTQLCSLVSHFLEKNVTVKIALPRTENRREKRSFQDLISQKKGLSKCSKVIRNAVTIERTSELELQNQPLQVILEKLVERRQSALNISTKETLEHRIRAAVSLYNKAEPIGLENVIAINLWLRGIPNFIPSNFRAVMIPHPDWSDERNRQMLASKDKRTGLLSSLKITSSLENKVIVYDNQYWTVVSDVRLKAGQNRGENLVVYLKLKNYRGSLNIVIADGDVQINQLSILDPDTSILVCDFKLYTRIIPYYNGRGELTGIERTFFGPNAGKPHLERKPGGLWKSKLARGYTSGASARLYGQKDAPYVILGEGAENVLSALHVIRKSPRAARFFGLSFKENSQDLLNCQFIASLGVNDLIKVPLEESAQTVILLADNDGYNMETKQALIETVDHFLSRGIKVKIALAIAESLGKKRDINDVLVEEGFAAAENMLCNAIEITSREELGIATEILQLSFLKLSLKEQLRDVSSEMFPKRAYELGQIYVQLEKHADAISCYQEALIGASGKLKTQTLDALGTALSHLGKYDLALDSHEKSLKEKVQRYQSTDHVDIAHTQEEIGSVYREKGMFDMALSFLKNSLEIKVRYWKSDAHENLFSLYDQLGNLYLKQRHFDLALFNYQKSIQLQQKKFGTAIHPIIVKTMEKIGDTHFKKKDYEQALDCYKHCLEILQKLFCSDRHKLDEGILFKIAKAYYLQNNIRSSLEYYGKSFCVQKQVSLPRALKQLLERANQIFSQTKEQKFTKKEDRDRSSKLSLTDSKILSIAILRDRAKKTRQIALDVEMTGSSSSIDRITEIGCVVLSDGQKTGERFQAYINPGRSVRPEAHRITGLTQRFLQKHSPFPEVAKDFLTFIKGADLIIHAADSDLEFLKMELKRSNISYDIQQQHEIIDTLMIAKKLFPNQKNSLDALNTRLNINRERLKHGALLDAEILADVYRALLSSPVQV